MKRAGLLLKPFGDYFLFGNVFDALAVVQFAVDDHRIPRQMLLVRHGLVHALERNAERLVVLFLPIVQGSGLNVRDPGQYR